jgi:dipeptidyl-peptidase 4
MSRKVWIAAGWLLAVVAQMALPPVNAGESAQGAVLNGRLEVRWLTETDGCWYRRQSAPGRQEFVLVDAVQGTRVLAFDHQRMAASLSTALSRQVSAENLPITDLQLADQGRTLLIAANGRWWECPRTTLALVASSRSPTASPLEHTPRPTRETGDATTLEIVNRTAGTIDLWWSTFDGGRKSYAHIPPGATSQQNTFAGHVWIVTDQESTVLGVVEAHAGPSRVEIDGKNLPRPQPVRDPNQSPDGKWQVFLHGHDLWLRPLGGTGDVALTENGTYEDHYDLPVVWSPDSTHVVAKRIRPGEGRTITLIESSPKDQVQPKSRTIAYAKPGDRIDTPRPCLFRVADREQIAVDTRLLEEPWSLDDVVWNADGAAFTVLFNQRGHQIMRVVEIDRSGKARTLIEERAKTFIDYAGKSYYERLAGRNEILWLSERDGWNHLYRYDAVSGQVKNQITKGAWAIRSIERVDEQAGLIWFTAGGMVPGEDPYHVHLARVAFDGSGLTRLTDGDGTHTVQWSPNRRWFIDTWSRVDAPPQHVLRDGVSGKLVVALEQADISALRASGWQQPERFVAKGRDGTTDIYGVLWRPKRFDPAKHYPVVECIYAGPQSAYVPKAFRAGYGQQDIADLGFVVGMIDGMGTSYRSKAFHDVCWKNLADAGFLDRIPWWKVAATTRPWLDLTRVGIYGGSAGGQNALGALLSHPEFYNVAVADCGCHDNRMDKIWWNELWMGWPVGPHYAEQSNVTNAAKLQGKLMLIVGELDDNVDPSSTFQVASALEKAGKDFELVVVHGTGHGAAETSFGKMKRAGFLVRHLGGPKD